MKLKKIASMMLAAALTVGCIAGCGASGQTAETKASSTAEETNVEETKTDASKAEGETSAKGVQRATLSMDLSRQSINPMAVKSADPVCYSTYEMLFATSNGIGTSLVPIIADGTKGEFNGYDHEAGTGVYTFYIQDCVYDHAGNHLTASDVVFSFEKTKEFGNTSGWGVIEGWKAVDEYTVEMTCERELNLKGEFENVVLRCFMFTEKAYNDSPSQFASDECGTGHYALKEYVDGSSTSLVKVEDYWQKDESKLQRSQWANVDEINIIKITENSQKVTALTTGTTDLATQIPNDYIARFMEGGSYSGTYDTKQTATHGVSYIELNVADGKIATDKNFRLAVLYAVGSDELVAGLGNPLFIPAYSFGCDTFADYNKEWDSWDNYNTSASDVEKAKAYLADSSYNGEEIILCSNSNMNDQVVLIQAMLNRVGINCALDIVDGSMLVTETSEPSNWDIFFNSTASSDYNTSIWSHIMNKDSFSTGGTEGFYVDDDFQMLLTKAMANDSSVEDQDAFWNACVDEALIKGLYASSTLMAYGTNMIEEFFFNDKGAVLPGACIYNY